MRQWGCILLFFLMWPQYIRASELAYESLPPELVKLQSQGRLTVRALWAWKLVPDSTAQMALELRALGHDLLGANQEQLVTWLKQAEDGQLQLTAKQKDFFIVLVDRMNFGIDAVGPETSEIRSVVNVSKETQVVSQAGPPSAAAEKVIAPTDSSSGKRADAMDAGQMMVDLGTQATAGNTKAMLALALIVKTDAAGPPDPYKSIKLLKDAAAAGEADAMAVLADEYESGLWINQDVEKATQLRQRAAEAGSQLVQWGLE